MTCKLIITEVWGSIFFKPPGGSRGPWRDEFCWSSARAHNFLQRSNRKKPKKLFDFGIKTPLTCETLLFKNTSESRQLQGSEYQQKASSVPLQTTASSWHLLRIRRVSLAEVTGDGALPLSHSLAFWPAPPSDIPSSITLHGTTNTPPTPVDVCVCVGGPSLLSVWRWESRNVYGCAPNAASINVPCKVYIKWRTRHNSRNLNGETNYRSALSLIFTLYSEHLSSRPALEGAAEVHSL